MYIVLKKNLREQMEICCATAETQAGLSLVSVCGVVRS